MMKNLTIFKNKEFGQIRTCMVDGETFFVGKDVASALGYANPTKAVTVHVDEEDRSMSEMGTLQRGNQSTIIINESGLYALILSSKLESAKRFKRWVTSEVLPQIRKNGRYELEHHNELLEKHNKQLTNQTRVLACRNALLEEIAKQQKPLTDYARTILSSTQTVTVTQIAQDYGISAKKLNQMLKDFRIQYRLGGQWILYAPYLHKGYVQGFSSYFVKPDGEVKVQIHTRWTQSGRLFLYEELKKAGILPLIESQIINHKS
ncbi:MAG: phage antirepressor KilAC domain-containing protein [Bacteroidaceae bacterium]|nr:phage antirepressor KilAC domain-containing protein [Bacteroidaceae bacterium]